MGLRKLRGWAAICLVLLLLGCAPIVQGQANPAEPSAGPEPETLLTDFLVRSVTPPRRDDYDLYSRLKSTVGPNSTRTTTKPAYKLGDQETFYVFDLQRKQSYQVIASLVALTTHVYMFLDNAYKLNPASLRTAAETFENKIYPTDRQYFGEEPNPGVDNDPHLIILNTPLKGVSGYFSSDDVLLRPINPFSNEREMFFIGNNPENTDSYFGTLAHEFQHMIEFNVLPNQDIWLNEGSSVLAQQLNGYSSGKIELSFFGRPDTQLNNWTCSPCGTAPHYGAGYSWLSYLNDQFGFDSIRNIAANGQGLTGFNAVDWSLAASGHPELTADSVFKQWVLVNYLNRRSADPRYNYKAITDQVNRLTPAKPPFSQANLELNQYAAQYFDVSAANNGFTVDFKGTPTVGLSPTQPHNGNMVWWANRGDNSDSTLSREFDLSAVSSATLKFWTWFDLEPRFDYLYIEASLDGKSWQPLATKYTTAPDPTSRAYGPAYTGQSGPNGSNLVDQEAVTAGWVQETVDLSKYAGKKVQFRLEYVTDEAYNRNGALFDDFEIPETGWKDDVEGGATDWQVNGFVRTNNLLPQHYSVQIISRDGTCADSTLADLSQGDNDQSCLQELTLDATNSARQFFPYQHAVLVVAPYAPKTLVPAHFNLNVIQGR